MSHTNTQHLVNQLIPNAAIFYQKLRNYHWNIKGEVFFELHEKFEELYTEWSEIIDTLAERVLMLGGKPYSTLRDMVEHSSLPENLEISNERQMVESVVLDLTQLAQSFSQVGNESASRKDRVTTYILDNILASTEKHLWMLKTWLAR